MLRPFLLIGVGGSGGKTLRIIKHELKRRLAEIGWDARHFRQGGGSSISTYLQTLTVMIPIFQLSCRVESTRDS